MIAPKPQKVIGFGAHPDDVEIYMLGTLLALKNAGWEVGWTIATDGAAANGASDPQLVVLRKEEALAAGKLTDCKVSFLDFPDGDLCNSDGLSRQIKTILDTQKPDLIITHHLEDYHPDHRTLARILADLRPSGTMLLHCEPMIGIGAHPKLLVDVTPQFDTKLEALRCHASQMPSTEFLQIWNRFRGLQFGNRKIKFAEGFAPVHHLNSGNVVQSLTPALNIALLS